MEITVPVKEKDVIDYDFSLTNGVRICQTLDASVGDTFEEAVDRFCIFLSEKPRLENPDELMAAEELTIYKSQVAILIKRKRKQRMPSEAELFDMKKTLHNLVKTVQ